MTQLPNKCPVCNTKRILNFTLGHRTYANLRSHRKENANVMVHEVVCADCGNTYAADCDLSSGEMTIVEHPATPATSGTDPGDTYAVGTTPDGG